MAVEILGVTRRATLPVRVGSYRLQVRPNLAVDMVRKLLKQSEMLPAPDFAPNRKRGRLNVPGAGPDALFIKRYAATDAQSKALKRRHPLHRLRRRYAYNEGNAYLRFAAADIAVPACAFFGEEWRFGVRGSGVVAVDFLEGPSVQEALLLSDPGYWVKDAVASLIKMHQLGYTHGDANLINFIAFNKRSYAIDLENSRPVSDKKRSSDLINVIKSIEYATSDSSLTATVLPMYEKSGLKLPRAAENLMSAALQKAHRQRVKETG